MEKTVQELVEKVADKVAEAVATNPDAPQDPKSLFMLGAEFMDEQYQAFFKDFQKELEKTMSKREAADLVKKTLDKYRSN